MKKAIVSIVFSFLLNFSSPVNAADISSFTNETIYYDIKKVGMKAGEAVLNFKGLVDFEGQKMFLIYFKAEALKFLDEEKIYINPQTFLPYVVERDINVFGKKEKIREEYFHAKGEVKVIKTVAGKVTTESFKKDYELDNVYAFIYRHRSSGSFEVGKAMSMNLPTKIVNLSIIENTKIKAGKKKMDAFFMQSDPKEFNIWFDVSSAKIPLRIDGALGVGNTALIMRSYVPPSLRPAKNR